MDNLSDQKVALDKRGQPNHMLKFRDSGSQEPEIEVESKPHEQELSNIEDGKRKEDSNNEF